MAAQLLAQLAHVTLDDVLVEAQVEEAVNGVEQLGFGKPFSLMADQMLENAQFATGQDQGAAGDFGIPAVQENADQAGRRFTRTLRLFVDE